ncbi:NAD(P)-dependent oxidoreductase [Microbaculum marinisediminis]|uniref:NAD(P)-dependent oxidoreductase n=1 Tax=Microbaculum marinisediminis TaxID=2931392 RepID=A0AAW5R1A2_9HYPH|nr:NAD(P)-dependent oxidoreductase [Microbaculum sp. A6E488]MCT8973090.1 NAD(P)-dependent oxidoreductase [Microbaculum sp. A6E488]
MGDKRIGFIGVGLMGHGMASNIVEKGWPLTVMGHRNRAPVEDLVSRGALEAKTPREMAEASDILFLCVTGSPQIEDLMRRSDGILAGAHDGLIVVDTSTAIPDSTISLAAELEAKGAAMADAPLGGTPAQAEAGELSAMVGASPQVFAAIEPVLQAWAAKVVHLGPVGDGHKMKLLNNFLSLGYGALYAEALAVARKVGISAQTFDSVIRGSRMDCGFYQTFIQYSLTGDRDVHKFTLSNAHKDLRYLAAMANEAVIANHIGAAAKNTYAYAEAIGRGGDYVPFLAEIIAEANGVKT